MTTIARGTDTLTRDALTVLQPGFTGTTAPDWLLRRLGEGLASVGLFGRNIASPEQLAALTAQLRAERDDVLVAIDEEGGDVTRLEVRTGSSFPGNHALGAVDDVSLTREVAARTGPPARRLRRELQLGPVGRRELQPLQPRDRRTVLRRRPRPGRPAHGRLRHRPAVRRGRRLHQALPGPRRHRGRLPPRAAPHRRGRERSWTPANWRPFRAAIAAGSRAIMSAHILVPALDPDRPATLSRTDPHRSAARRTRLRRPDRHRRHGDAGHRRHVRHRARQRPRPRRRRRRDLRGRRPGRRRDGTPPARRPRHRGTHRRTPRGTPGGRGGTGPGAGPLDARRRGTGRRAGVAAGGATRGSTSACVRPGGP